MNKSKVNTIIVVACLALIGLIAVQMYWINNAIGISNQRFDQNVNEALNKVVVKVDKENTAAKITKRFNLRTQGIRTHTQQDSLGTIFQTITDSSYQNDFGVKKNNINVKIYEQYTSDSAGILVKRERQKSYSGDSASSDFSLNSEIHLPDHIQQFHSSELQNELFKNRDNMVNDIFDELVSINIYNDYNPSVDSLLLDSIICSELAEKGITANYIFGVEETLQPENDTTLLSERLKLLYASKYKINLSPDNVFITPQYLSIHFSNQQNYILQSLLLMLSISIIVIILIIYSFYYIVSTVFKQKRISEIKNDFISNMTHEFKTPISTISLAAEMLSDKTITNTPEQKSKFIKMIGNENKRLGILVENILQTAILDKGELKLKFQDLDIHNLIEQTISNIKLQVDNKEGEVSTQLSATATTIAADRVHITNVIFNLIDNALKYTTEKPVIHVSTKNNDTGIFIAVKDNGIGINTTDQKLIFDTMFRVHTGNVHTVKGFGLGLSYVKTVIEKHNGTITIESAVGEGSTFTVYLPLKQKNN